MSNESENAQELAAYRFLSTLSSDLRGPTVRIGTSQPGFATTRDRHLPRVSMDIGSANWTATSKVT